MESIADENTDDTANSSDLRDTLENLELELKKQLSRNQRLADANEKMRNDLNGMQQRFEMLQLHQ